LALMFLALALHSSFDTILSLILVAAYSSIRALVFWWIFAKDSPKRRMYGRIFLVVMLLIALGAAIYVIGTQLPTRETQIIQSVTLVFALGFVAGQYMPGRHPVRITVFLYAIMLFIMQTPLMILESEGAGAVGRWNIMGMLIEVSKMISVIIFYALIIQRNIYKKKLAKIKAAVNCELSKINSDSDISILADTGLMSLNKLELLVAKMVRLELATIDRSEITNTTTAEQQTFAILDDLNTVHDVKIILERVIKLKMQRLDDKSLPHRTRIQPDIKEAMLPKSKSDATTTNASTPV